MFQELKKSLVWYHHCTLLNRVQEVVLIDIQLIDPFDDESIIDFFSKKYDFNIKKI